MPQCPFAKDHIPKHNGPFVKDQASSFVKDQATIGPFVKDQPIKIQKPSFQKETVVKAQWPLQNIQTLAWSSANARVCDICPPT